MSLEVAVVGAGSWGTTVASITARNAPVVLWGRDAAMVKEINASHSNEKYLPGAILNQALRATTDIGAAVGQADVVVVAIPSQSFRAVLSEVKPHIRPWVPVISLSKGLELATGKRMTEIVNELLPGHPVGVLTGPNLAREIMQGSAAASVLAMEDEIIQRALQPLFSSGLFRVYTNDDLVGCELGGVLKNIIAIATGIGDGAGVGDNTRSALVTRGLAEITRLGVAMGGRAATFAGLAGMGDLVATCTSVQSRNHFVGVELGKGRSLDEIIASMHMVAEGVKTCPVVVDLARRYQVAMPITQGVYEVVHQGKTTHEAFSKLQLYATGAEHEPG